MGWSAPFVIAEYAVSRCSDRRCKEIAQSSVDDVGVRDWDGVVRCLINDEGDG